MRKLFTFFAAMLITGSLLAGGLVTNTNQSAAWVRLPSRNASVGIDAVYFNPAGLMKLENGFHVSVSNQSIMQTRTIKNYYSGPGGSYGLNQQTYKGTVNAPLSSRVFQQFINWINLPSRLDFTLSAVVAELNLKKDYLHLKCLLLTSFLHWLLHREPLHTSSMLILKGVQHSWVTRAMYHIRSMI